MLNQQGQQKLVDSLNSTLYIHVCSAEYESNPCLL